MFEYIKLSSVDTLLNTNKCSAVKRAELCSAFAKKSEVRSNGHFVHQPVPTQQWGRGLEEVMDRNKMAADESCFSVTNVIINALQIKMRVLCFLIL